MVKGPRPRLEHHQLHHHSGPHQSQQAGLGNALPAHDTASISGDRASVMRGLSARNLLSPFSGYQCCTMGRLGPCHTQILTYVLPLPVWPYAKQVAFPPWKIVCTSGLAVNLGERIGKSVSLSLKCAPWNMVHLPFHCRAPGSLIPPSKH